MALLADYTADTISVAANGTAVTGSGTAWQTAGFREGDWLVANGWVNVVADVNSNTSLTLAQPWRGGALSGAIYRLRYMSDGSRASAQARQLVDMLGGRGNLAAIGALASAANTMLYFTDAGTDDVTPLTAFARTLLDDANAAAVVATLELLPVQTNTLDRAGQKLLRLGAFGVGAHTDLRGTVWSTGVPSDLYGFGDAVGLGNSSELGITAIAPRCRRSSCVRAVAGGGWYPQLPSAVQDVGSRLRAERSERVRVECVAGGADHAVRRDRAGDV